MGGSIWAAHLTFHEGDRGLGPISPLRRLALLLHATREPAQRRKVTLPASGLLTALEWDAGQLTIEKVVIRAGNSVAVLATTEDLQWAAPEKGT